MQFLVSLLAFIVAIGVLVTAHEFGHFITARRLGIKVLRFSIGFGKPLLIWRRKGDDTEYVISALPLGGYVKMLDEREGAVSDMDLPRAFNRQPLWKRSTVVFAGPAFNLLFAVLAYWIVFMAGIAGLKPMVGYVTPASAAADAGLQSGDTILSVAGHETATWDDAQLGLFRAVLGGPHIDMTVRTPAGQERSLTLQVEDPQALTEPNQMLVGLGLSLVPPLSPVVSQVQADGTAAASGLKAGDRIVSLDGVPVTSWQDAVRVLRASPGKTLALVIERQGRQQDLTLKVGTTTDNGVNVGHIGAAGPLPPEGFYDSLRVEQRYNPPAALWQGLARTADMSWLTLDAAWNMLIGKVSWHNISGPIDIAQYAGYAAQSGLVVFLEFLAFVSISLGVLNLLPIPVLDGGHLLYFAVESLKGSPLSERAEALGQRVGITLLMLLVGFAIYNDLLRAFG